MLDNWSPGMVAPGAVLVPPGGFLVLFCKNICICIFSWSHSWMGTVTLRWLFMMFIIFISNTCCYDELLSDIFQWVWFKVGSVLATLPRMTLTTSDLIGFQKCFQNPAKFTKNTFLTAIAKLLDLRNAFAKASPDIVPLALQPRHFSCWNAQRKPVKWKLKSWLWEMKLAWLQANFHNFHEKSLKSREEARSIEGTNGMLCSDFSSQCWQRKRGKR